MKSVKIKNIRKITNKSKKYDIQTTSNNFFANNILVHNSQINFQMNGASIEARNRNMMLLKGNMDRQFHVIPTWLAERWESISSLVKDGYVLFGEWLFHVHTVFYDKLPDWFAGFNLFDLHEDRFLEFLDGRKKIVDAGLAVVPLLDTVVFKDSILFHLAL